MYSGRETLLNMVLRKTHKYPIYFDVNYSHISHVTESFAWFALPRRVNASTTSSACHISTSHNREGLKALHFELVYVCSSDKEVLLTLYFSLCKKVLKGVLMIELLSKFSKFGNTATKKTQACVHRDTSANQRHWAIHHSSRWGRIYYTSKHLSSKEE